MRSVGTDTIEKKKKRCVGVLKIRFAHIFCTPRSQKSRQLRNDILHDGLNNALLRRVHDHLHAVFEVLWNGNLHELLFSEIVPDLQHFHDVLPS